MLLEGRTGPIQAADSSLNTIRLDKYGRLVATVDNAESSSRSGVFTAVNQAGITTQAGLSGTTPALTLFNPKNSGVNGILIFAGCINTVAFVAASVAWLAANTNVAAADVTGTAAVVRCLQLGNGKSPVLSALLAATLPAAPVAIAILGVGLTGALITAPAGQTLGRYFNGSIIIAPGSAISFQTSTASGTNGFFGELVWEEQPIV